MNLRQRVADKLNVKEEDLIWSEQCDNPETIFHNKELNTVSFRKLGYWVVK